MTTAKTTMNNLGVVMFSVADQDAAMEFYTGTLGFEVRSDTTFGPDDDMRWVEVAPPGSVARLALVPPHGGQPGGGTIGVEAADVRGEHERLTRLGVRIDSEPGQERGAPLLFLCQDPDGNHIAVVEAP